MTSLIIMASALVLTLLGEVFIFGVPITQKYHNRLYKILYSKYRFYDVAGFIATTENMDLGYIGKTHGLISSYHLSYKENGKTTNRYIPRFSKLAREIESEKKRMEDFSWALEKLLTDKYSNQNQV